MHRPTFPDNSIALSKFAVPLNNLPLSKLDSATGKAACSTEHHHCGQQRRTVSVPTNGGMAMSSVANDFQAPHGEAGEATGHIPTCQMVSAQGKFEQPTSKRWHQKVGVQVQEQRFMTDTRAIVSKRAIDHEPAAKIGSTHMPC